MLIGTFQIVMYTPYMAQAHGYGLKVIAIWHVSVSGGDLPLWISPAYSPHSRI